MPQSLNTMTKNKTDFMIVVAKLILSLLFPLTPLPLSKAGFIEACRSNATHICWPGQKPNPTSPLADADKHYAIADTECWWQTRREAEKSALAYLRDNVMPFDTPNMETLGFVKEHDVDVDGLDSGLVGPTVKLAIDAKVRYLWADGIPQDVYFEYVLNYANVNEARSNWRPLILQAIRHLLDSLPADASVNTVVKAVNSNLWTALSRGENPIVFKAGQTPLIFDPMSVIAFGYGSCTGLTILFVNALRAAGVAARLVGTPAWQGVRENGNHNWVEVYRDGRWDFMEPSAGVDDVDDLDKLPCTRWFCSQSKQYGKTRVFAARLDRKKADTAYPMAWEWNNSDVPGEDRTDYYIAACSLCD